MSTYHVCCCVCRCSGHAHLLKPLLCALVCWSTHPRLGSRRWRPAHTPSLMSWETRTSNCPMGGRSHRCLTSPLKVWFGFSQNCSNFITNLLHYYNKEHFRTANSSLFLCLFLIQNCPVTHPWPPSWFLLMHVIKRVPLPPPMAPALQVSLRHLSALTCRPQILPGDKKYLYIIISEN